MRFQANPDGTILAQNDIELLCEARGSLTACWIILRSEIKVNSVHIEYSERFFLLKFTSLFYRKLVVESGVWGVGAGVGGMGGVTTPSGSAPGKDQGRNTTRQSIPGPCFVFWSALLFADNSSRSDWGSNPRPTVTRTIKSRLVVITCQSYLAATNRVLNPTRGRPANAECTVRQRAYWLADCRFAKAGMFVIILCHRQDWMTSVRYIMLAYNRSPMHILWKHLVG
jgi:hypothetical protein